MSARFNRTSTSYRGQGATVPGSENTPTGRKRRADEIPDADFIAQIGEAYERGESKYKTCELLQIGRTKYDKALSFYLMNKFAKGGE